MYNFAIYWEINWMAALTDLEQGLSMYIREAGGLVSTKVVVKIASYGPESKG